ncbi:hypothetical protein [Teredinibacter purpureus]|uniref:hypothetical protein n=1 Tax=Teredinibacter purpureus TaxID=2731756 RepID=UPI0013C3EAAC|nr:hypothetical protein [Teredinibacter purpureus]
MPKFLREKYPDYNSLLTALHNLIDKRGDCSLNLSSSEREEYEALCEWYGDAH